ncbi:hypothetical protein [Sphingomonas qomolangmaensis]|uniref:Phage tail protein n=1 Tax=Sphingomonas qomolangmaensis TaxID=2918765 RepID=A0ABY5LA08_9SPHN|nr:hypothetical protein [Sphingomonas qomolangmaensis]UUL83803.1 hypothetical protein NMP03_06305 [Sphingomonas qomolangmaensis]
MQEAKAFTIAAGALDTSNAPADRLVLVNQFVPYALPIKGGGWPYALTASQIDRAARFVARMSPADAKKADVPAEIYERAQIWRNRAETDSYIGGDTDDLATTQPTTQVTAQLGTEFGWLFLDRTRLRPAGFALGEHLTTISLAPGEEVTIEQRSFTKIERAFEEASESETTADLELSSTYATELSESLDWQVSLGRKRSDNTGQKVSGSYEGVGVEASASQANDLTDGDNRTARSSTKLTENATRKVAAKQRRQHKTVFKLSQESRFDTSSKRVLRNSNALAPYDLLYFKVQQRLQIFHERYGVRLCWAPSVAEPGKMFLERLNRRRAELRTAALAEVDVGPRPVAPLSPTAGLPQSGQAVEMADRFDPVWGGQSADYTIDIAAPPGYIWDGQAPTVDFDFTMSRPSHANLVTFAQTGSGVRLIVHVGVADCRNPFQPDFWQGRGTATLTCTANFVPAPNPGIDQAYGAAYATYTSQLADYNSRLAIANAAATRAVDMDWDLERAQLIANVDTTTEIIGTLIEQAFPAQVRDDPWELDLWERIFDFPRITIRLYPSWWNGPELNDAKGAADSFLNASWARIYLPIRPEAEAEALRWLMERRIGGPGSTAVEAMIEYLVKELATYRLANFGSDIEAPHATGSTVATCPGIDQPVKCLGYWEESLPTDGTHLEVLQATTSAADDAAKARLDAEGALAAARAKSEDAEANIRTTVASAPFSDLDNIRIHIGGSGPDT